MSDCHACRRPMREHATLDLAKCMNPYCAEFDRPRIEQRAARLATEAPELPRTAARPFVGGVHRQASSGDQLVED